MVTLNVFPASVILAIAKKQLPVKADLWVRALMPFSEGKHDKNQAITTQKKKRTSHPLEIL